MYSLENEHLYITFMVVMITSERMLGGGKSCIMNIHEDLLSPPPANILPNSMKAHF